MIRQVMVRTAFVLLLCGALVSSCLFMPSETIGQFRIKVVDQNNDPLRPKYDLFIQDAAGKNLGYTSITYFPDKPDEHMEHTVFQLYERGGLTWEEVKNLTGTGSTLVVSANNCSDLTVPLIKENLYTDYVPPKKRKKGGHYSALKLPIRGATYYEYFALDIQLECNKTDNKGPNTQ